MPAHKNKSSRLHASVLRLTRLHFIFVAVYALQTIIHDAWNLVTPRAAMNRWTVTAILLGVNAMIWYLVHNTFTSTVGLKMLTFFLILTDIAVVTFNIYSQRGMASRAVMLYAVPIAVSAVLLSRAALYTTAALCAAVYFAAAYIYFVLNFNEGYKIELYGEVGFYSIMFFVLASTLWVAVRSKNHIG